jgi:hypothetical protein
LGMECLSLTFWAPFSPQQQHSGTIAAGGVVSASAGGARRAVASTAFL